MRESIMASFLRCEAVSIDLRRRIRGSPQIFEEILKGSVAATARVVTALRMLYSS
jgi:hypothetical protein